MLEELNRQKSPKEKLRNAIRALVALGAAAMPSPAQAWQETNYVPQMATAATMHGADFLMPDIQHVSNKELHSSVSHNVKVFEQSLKDMQDFESQVFSDAAAQEEALLRRSLHEKPINEWDRYVSYTQRANDALRQWKGFLASDQCTDRQQLITVHEELLTLASATPKAFPVNPNISQK